MSIKADKTTNGVTVRLTAYNNCDDVQLFWRVSRQGQDDVPLEGCLGFMIERQRLQNGGQWAPVEILRNRVSFTDAVPNEVTAATSEPSNIWPFQRYEWTDHGANNGQTVKYRVSAVALTPGGTAGTSEMQQIADSGWTQSLKVDADTGNGTEAYFNRGFVMSQFMARIAREKHWKATDIKDHVADIEEPVRRFLSGELRLALLRLLDEAIGDPRLDLYIALYELSDQELIDRLKLLKARAHVVLSNGSDESGDGNKDARDQLNAAGVDVSDRLLGSKGLGHNKFVVVVSNNNNRAIKAWTGSTNWAPTGLCTQVNNGILIADPAIAALYLDQWHRLQDAGSDFPPELVADNARSPRTASGTDVWFTRVRNKPRHHTDNGIDIDALIDHVKSAETMILYVMFQPGPDPLADIIKRASDIYVRGVVSTVTPDNREKFQIKGIDLESQEYETALIQPEGVVSGFSEWLKEVTRAQFLSFPNHPGIGHAITHSKMIVTDPFSPGCKVITGSHNFSGSASEQNDDNFIVVHGNAALAEAYSVACLATYEHYSWRAYLKKQFDLGKPPWSHLSDNPAWQADYLSDMRKRHLAMWCP
jgi:hypothetical protein